MGISGALFKSGLYGKIERRNVQIEMFYDAN